MELIPIRVECRARCREEEPPRFLFWAGKRFEVRKILDRWYQGGIDPVTLASDYFKVRVAEGGEAIVKHDWFGTPGTC